MQSVFGDPDSDDEDPAGDAAAADVFGQKTAAAVPGKAVASSKKATALPPSSALPSAPHALVGRCRLPVSKPVLKALNMVSAHETIML